jgi:hypothetical protein
MNSFAGRWTDLGNVKITITEKNNLVSVKYANGRGPFRGFEVDLYAPVLSVDFTDDQPFTGVLAGTTIQWSNGTVWKKA